MKKIMFILLLLTHEAFSWGFYGHRRINEMACYTLPPELFGFYKLNIDYLIEHSVDADKRRHSNPDEPPRHFIDLDHYGENPLENVPHRWSDAVEKYSEDTLKAYGIVPWHILQMMYRLTEAFRQKDAGRILYYSANLGHYSGDAHVPLHCTENYNGQLTGQRGIHGFWESRLPELFADNYDYLAGRARYISNLNTFTWKNIGESFQAIDSVLAFEKKLTGDFKADRKYSVETRGASTIRVYSREFSEAYHRMLDGQVERRMVAAIISTGSYWYTAWVNAGMPDLSALYSSGFEEQPVQTSDTTAKKTFVTDCD